MEYVLWSIVIVFIAAAIQDYKKREVSDYITIIAWGLSAFVFNLQYFIFFFLACWAIASVCERIKMPLMAFGDILWLPIYFSLLSYLGENGILFSLIAILISQLYLWYGLKWKSETKEKVNGSPFVSIMLVLFALIGAVHYIVIALGG
jgi:hypothetical protein